MSKHVKTTCGFVNIARKAEIARRKVFFQPKLLVFSYSERICSLARSAGEWWPFLWFGLEKWCVPIQTGVCGCRNFH